MYYIGMDVHKLSISFCIKQADGALVGEGKLKANRQTLTAWAERLPQPWTGAMEATLVSHWIYHHLQPFAADLQMGNPSRMKAIGCAKKKTDRIDAAMIADLLRCNLLPAVNVLPEPFVRMRQPRRLRCRVCHSSVAVELYVLDHSATSRAAYGGGYPVLPSPSNLTYATTQPPAAPLAAAGIPFFRRRRTSRTQPLSHQPR
ncbi:MAG TPA: transposase, partial [Bryobacteraceae bacterium]|nr:transposase [Bryobacteraceae bacterium]